MCCVCSEYVVSGFNVFPNELENVISMCPGVVECAAVGVPDAKQGRSDVPKAPSHRGGTCFLIPFIFPFDVV